MTATVAAVVVAAVVVAFVVGWVMLSRQDPENAARHMTPTSLGTSEQSYADRLAGPDAEPVDPGLLGGDHRPLGRSVSPQRSSPP